MAENGLEGLELYLLDCLLRSEDDGPGNLDHVYEFAVILINGREHRVDVRITVSPVEPELPAGLLEAFEGQLHSVLASDFLDDAIVFEELLDTLVHGSRMDHNLPELQCKLVLRVEKRAALALVFVLSLFLRQVSVIVGADLIIRELVVLLLLQDALFFLLFLLFFFQLLLLLFFLFLLIGFQGFYLLRSFENSDLLVVASELFRSASDIRQEQLKVHFFIVFLGLISA